MKTSDIRDALTRALKRSTAEYCEVRFEETRTTYVDMRGEQVRTASLATSVGGNVRALDGGWGFVCFNSLDDLPRRVDEACALARILGESAGWKAHLHPVDPIEDDVPGDFRRPAFSGPSLRWPG